MSSHDQIRDMCAGDVIDVATMHREAFAGTIGVRLGQGYAEALFHRYLAEPEAVTLLCEAPGREIAGYVFGAPEYREGPINRALLPTIVRSVIAHPRVLFHRQSVAKVSNRLRMLVDSRPRVGTSVTAALRPWLPTYYLIGIGVAPLFRGRRIGELLMEALEARAFDAGYRSVLLSAYSSNTAARRLYARRGWTEVADDGRVVYYMTTRGEPDQT